MFYFQNSLNCEPFRSTKFMTLGLFLLRSTLLEYSVSSNTFRSIQTLKLTLWFLCRSLTVQRSVRSLYKDGAGISQGRNPPYTFGTTERMLWQDRLNSRSFITYYPSRAENITFITYEGKMIHNSAYELLWLKLHT